MKNWHVYLVECSDGTYYCGITNNLIERLKAHNKGTGAKYTRGRGPVKLINSVSASDQGDAARMEYRVKLMSRKKKLEFFNQEGGTS